MSEPIRKILFLKVPGADDVLASGLAQGIPSDDVHHEFMDVKPGQYEAILDRLAPGVLPVVLKAPR